ncbi:MAG TPA: hypothetical protein PL048_26395 [Leptospiraceae bacterium]|nr:hypothetical protein [Leptospiraceae bacterium]HMZ62330.1 hypothetical protein [Leptospiraceae bacterium]HNF16885.1 hypothetical protein [Leptospiraceae bacterium]HNF28125.1 hypothetical protein [Leptospiraceae bacterium]HNI27897.1 hypothetical protein [Leptospiraceae bacterium]
MSESLPGFQEVLILNILFSAGFAFIYTAYFYFSSKKYPFLMKSFLVFFSGGVSSWFYYFFRFWNVREISPGLRSFPIFIGNLSARIAVFGFLITVLAYFIFLSFQKKEH